MFDLEFLIIRDKVKPTWICATFRALRISERSAEQTLIRRYSRQRKVFQEVSVNTNANFIEEPRAW